MHLVMHKQHLLLYITLLLLITNITACNKQKEHTAPAIHPRDSVAMMRSYGINTLISDSGVMKYRIVAERWDVNEAVNPPRWIFSRGLFMEQFDDKFHTEAYIQADTAYYYNVQKLWHLIGNVRAKTIDGVRFNSEELYWDQKRHELYSNKFSNVLSPQREILGSYFTSDEHMQHYKVSDTKGAFVRNNEDKDTIKQEDSTATDSAVIPKRAPAQPQRRH